MPAHSPFVLPLSADGEAVHDANGEVVVDFFETSDSYEMGVCRAAYIVQACNAFPALVAALEVVVVITERIQHYLVPADSASVDETRAALAKVKGGAP